MEIDKPESLKHFAIDSLNRSLLEQSAAIVVSLMKNRFKKKLNDTVG